MENLVNQRKKVIALGFFDGVHQGHGALLRKVLQRAEELNAIPAAVTFDAHPTAVITGKSVPLINTIQDRITLMHDYYGIQDVEVAHFDEEMMHQNWYDFIVEYLIKEQHACHLVCGHDFRFGYQGEGTPQMLKSACSDLGLGCDIIDKVERDGITVSSTYIRDLLAQGEMTRAVAYLGHPHILTGTVVHGKGLGRTIGIPTANLIPPDGLVPLCRGVYDTTVVLPDGKRYMAVTNVGICPTVNQGNHVTVEPWILDYEGDLYGQTIRVEFYHFLRGERKFGGLDELKHEIHKNAAETRKLLEDCLIP